MKAKQFLQEYLGRLADRRFNIPSEARALSAPGSRHPERQSKESLPDAAGWLESAGAEFDPRPEFISASRRRLQTHAGLRRRRNPWRTWQWSALYWWQSPALHVAMVVLLAATLYFNLSSVLRASGGWLPGDLLYPLKPAGEQIRLLTSLTAEGDARLHIEFAHQRLIEIQGLVFENRYDRIPAAVANFDAHVSQAVALVNGMAKKRQPGASELAAELQRTLRGQMGMVTLLKGFTPSTTRAEFERLLSISVAGMSGIRDVLSPKSGGSRPWG